MIDCVFKRQGPHGQELLFVRVYVDDLINVALNVPPMTTIKSELFKLFPAKDLGQASRLLGMKVEIDYENSRINLD